MFTPAFASNAASEAVVYYDSCTLEDGSVLAVSTLGIGNVVITLKKDNVLLESTEIDYNREVLVVTNATATTRSRSSNTREIPFSSYITKKPQSNTNKPAAARGKYTKFGYVSFRGQIRTDYFFTPKAEVQVRHNTPGDPVYQRVRVSNVSEVTTLIGLVVSALSIEFPVITAVRGFLISLGLITGNAIIAGTVDYVDLEAVRYGENIKDLYNGDEQEFPEGARIVATGNVKNGKHAKQVFYDGLCERHVRDAKIEFCTPIYSAFFRGYGTLRGMSFSVKK